MIDDSPPNDMKNPNTEVEMSSSAEGMEASSGTFSRLRSFGETPSVGMNHQPNKPTSSYLGSEMAFSESLGVYPIGSFGDTTPTATETDNYYNPMLSRNYSTFSQVPRGSPISPFNGPASEERPLYSRHSLGVFGYGENSIEPFPRGDMSLSNLQNVMDDDLFGNSAQQMGPSTSTGPSLGISSIGKPSPLSHPSMLGGNASLFSQATADTSLGGFGTVPPMMRSDLSPPLNGFSSLAPSTNNFMLNPFDNDDYSNRFHSFLYHSPSLIDPSALTPQARPAPFASNQSIYMTDYISDSSYSPRPRLSPMPSPYTDTDLSPRRVFPPSRGLMNGGEPRLQRSLSSLSSVNPSGMASTLPTSTTMDMPMNYHPSSSSSFKRKEGMKGTAWQTGDVDSYRGHIKEMSRDHNGCRALQQCLDDCPEKGVKMIYDEVGGELTELMMDSFGNYLFQKLVEVSSDEQRRVVVCTELNESERKKIISIYSLNEFMNNQLSSI